MKLAVAATTLFAALASVPMVAATGTVIVENNFNSNKNGWTYRDDAHFVSMAGAPDILVDG